MTMKKKMTAITSLVFFFALYGATAYCNIILIKSEFYKDGGTRCVEYEKNGSTIKCCIDGRSMVGTNEVFIGGYPGKKNVRIITLQEMKSVADDIAEIMNSAEYKKYSAMTHNEMRALIEINNHELDEQKMKERRKAASYRSLQSFKEDLLTRLQTSHRD